VDARNIQQLAGRAVGLGRIEANAAGVTGDARHQFRQLTGL
jgi:hypothetical protein